MNEQDYKKLLLQLKPQGLAWNKDDGSNLNKLASGESKEFARVEAYLFKILKEVNPLTTTELIEEWARIALPPDDCINQLNTPEEKRAAVIAKLQSLGGSDKIYFQNVAKAAGFLVSVSDGFVQFRAGASTAGDRILADGFAYTWEVRSPSNTVRYFRSGSGRSGDPIVYFGNALLECIMRDIKPSHTEVIFRYQDIIQNLAGNIACSVGLSGAMSIVRRLAGEIDVSVSTALLEPWTPDQLDDLLLWFDAEEFTSSAAVSSWTDKQGNRDAIQDTGANQPDSVTDVLNGRSIVRFASGDQLQIRSLEQFDVNNGLHFFAVCDLTAGGGLLFDRNQLFLRADTGEVQSEALTSSYRSNLHFSQDLPSAAVPGGSDGINGMALFGGVLYATGEFGLWKLESNWTWTEVTAALDTAAPRGKIIEYNGSLYAISGTVNKMYKWDGATAYEYTNSVDGSADLRDFVFNSNDSLFYIADGSNGKLITFDPSDNSWAEVGTGLTNCNSVESDGTNVYINKRDGTGDIYKWNGSTLASEGLSGISNPGALSWIQGTLWLYDSTTGKITNKANSYTLTDVPEYQYLIPQSMKEVNGELWLISDRTYMDVIARYTLDGTDLDIDGAGTLQLIPAASEVHRSREMLFIPGTDDLELFVSVGKGVQRIERKRYVTETDTVPAQSIIYFGIEDNHMQLSINGELVQDVTFATETYRNENILLEQIAITNGALVSFVDDLVTINPTADLPDNSVIEVTIEDGAITDWAGIDDWTFET